MGVPAPEPLCPESRGLSLAELYREHFDFVWRNLLRLGVPENALEDAVHDVFVVAHRRLPEFEARSHPTTWLFAIATRVAHEQRRKHRRHRVEPTPELVDEDGLPPDEAAARIQARRQVHWALQQLEPGRRAVFVMVELEQMTIPVIAEALGIPLNTAYSRLRLARRDFEVAIRRLAARPTWRQQ